VYIPKNVDWEKYTGSPALRECRSSAESLLATDGGKVAQELLV
jgi:hypothetical protein